jgi:exopolyphosphatase/guanosine-5'-triphosphate,3'-diphosphate pyrophosphatase
MFFATVDIGSNAGRLLISNVYEKNQNIYAAKISLVRVPLRLGMDVFESGAISDEKIEMLIKTLKAYNLICEVYKPIDFVACATSAIREAKNREYVLRLVKEETDIDLEVIDGIKEAKLISSANNIYINKKHKNTLYVDVGGGSTECSYFENDKFIASESFLIGTIRYLFDYVSIAEWNRLEQWLSITLKSNNKINCICSGGNINKLLKLFGNRDYTITKEQIANAVNELEKYSYEERMQYYSLRPDRADVIIPAVKIFYNIMKWSNIKYFVVPQIGLVDGLAIELYKKQESIGN